MWLADPLGKFVKIKEESIMHLAQLYAKTRSLQPHHTEGDVTAGQQHRGRCERGALQRLT